MSSMHHLNIQTIDFGIALRIGKTIYINKKIDKSSKLYNSLIKHESEHTDNFSLKDIKNDLSGKHLKGVKKEYYKFLFKNPKAWLQFLPIIRLEKKWIIDPIMIILWILMFIWICIIIWII